MNNSLYKKTVAIAIVISLLANFIFNLFKYYFIISEFEIIENFAQPLWMIFIITSLNLYITTLLTSFFTFKIIDRYLKKELIVKKDSKSFLSNIPERPFYFSFFIIGIFMIPITLVITCVFTPLNDIMSAYSYSSFVNFRICFRAVFSGVYGAFVTYLVILRAKIK